MEILPNQASDLQRRGRTIQLCGWLITLLSAGAALLPLFERRGGALVIGTLLIVAGLLETFAGSLRHETRKLAMLAGAVTIVAGILFMVGPATHQFLPNLAIVMGWLFLRSAILFIAGRLERGGVRRWTLIAAFTDLALAFLLLIGLQIATLVVAIFGATAPMVASFAWVLAVSFVADGMLQLEVASCAREEDV